MFEQVGEGYSFGSAIAQLFLSYVCSFGALAVVSRILPGPESGSETALCYLSVAVGNSLVAYLLSWRFPRTAVEGRWVCALPVVIELVVFVGDLLRGGATRTLFYVGPGEGESGWLLMLQTYPAWGCLCYSLMMIQRRHSSRRSLQRHSG